MWQQWIRRWMDMVFWWLPRDEKHSETETSKAEAEQVRQAGEAQPPSRATGPSQEAVAEASEPREQPASSELRPEQRSDTGAAKPKPEVEKSSAKSKPAAKPNQKAEPAGNDAAKREVTAIKGIGPAMQSRLASLNIRTVGDLAEADATSLLEDLKPTQRNLTRERVEGWIEAARKSR